MPPDFPCGLVHAEHAAAVCEEHRADLELAEHMALAARARPFREHRVDMLEPCAIDDLKRVLRGIGRENRLHALLPQPFGRRVSRECFKTRI